MKATQAIAIGRGSPRPVVEVRNLSVHFGSPGRGTTAVRDVSFEICAGEALGLVGESGSGKSTIAMAIAHYLDARGARTTGDITLLGRSVKTLSPNELRQLRLNEVSFVTQEPQSALNPTLSVGSQLRDVFVLLGATREEALERARLSLRDVLIGDVGRILKAYPHELSGGTLQRIVLAMALAPEPALLVLDEPTTSCDATTEASILDLIRRLRTNVGTAVLCISHDLSVIERLCDRVGVLYAGELVETGSVSQVIGGPRHPYTVGLLRATPARLRDQPHAVLEAIPGTPPRSRGNPNVCSFADRCPLVSPACRKGHPQLENAGEGHLSRCVHLDRAPEAHFAHSSWGRARTRLHSRTVLDVSNLSKVYRQNDSAQLSALTDVTFTLGLGLTLGVIGESGSGKSTLVKLLLGIERGEPGTAIQLDGANLDGITLERRDRSVLRKLQPVNQNPDSFLNRRHRVRAIIERPMKSLLGLPKARRRALSTSLAESVRLTAADLRKRPTALSGGLKQRVVIARALAADPMLLICDEPTSGLDVSVQAAVLNLILKLQSERDLSCIFVTHDLRVVTYMADHLLVLYLGRVMAKGPTTQVLGSVLHPYVETLLSSAGMLRGLPQIALADGPPDLSAPPSGCVFHTRCHRVLEEDTCSNLEPLLKEVAPGVSVRCHLPVEQLRR